MCPPGSWLYALSLLPQLVGFFTCADFFPQLGCAACVISVPLPGIDLMASAVGTQCLNSWTAREVPLCGCLDAKGARKEVSTGSHLPGSSGGAVATCSEHSGAPRLQGWGGEALVLIGPSQASPIPSTWGWPTLGQGQAWD